MEPLQRKNQRRDTREQRKRIERELPPTPHLLTVLFLFGVPVLFLFQFSFPSFAMSDTGNESTKCKECGGASICKHNRVRSQCK